MWTHDLRPCAAALILRTSSEESCSNWAFFLFQPPFLLFLAYIHWINYIGTEREKDNSAYSNLLFKKWISKLDIYFITEDPRHCRPCSVSSQSLSVCIRRVMSFLHISLSMSLKFFMQYICSLFFGGLKGVKRI